MKAIFSKDAVHVAGVGTVSLRVRRSPDRTGKGSHAVIRLQNVLHIPSSRCNIIGNPIFNWAKAEYTHEDPKSGGTLRHLEGKNPVAYFRPDPVPPLFVVSGPPVDREFGPSMLSPDGLYRFEITWPAEEASRWEAFQQESQEAKSVGKKKYRKGNKKINQTGAKIDSSSGETKLQDGASSKNALIEHVRATTCGLAILQPLSAEEKQWLKKHYDGEFKFLQSFQLSIYKDEERAYGRRILRGLMDRDREKDNDKNKVVEESDRTAAALATVIDDGAHFSDEELAFIDKHYQTPRTFMILHGLEFTRDEDLKEARIALRGLIRHDALFGERTVLRKP